MSEHIISLSKAKYIARIASQISLLLMFWWLGSIIQAELHLPVSAAVVGLFMVLIGLFSGLFKLDWIKSGSDFILGELVLCFIPCFVGLIKYKDLFIREGWQLIVAVVVGTICVMVFTAYSVHLGFKLETKLKQQRTHKTKVKHCTQTGE